MFARKDTKCGGALIMSNINCSERIDITMTSKEGHFECCGADIILGDQKCTAVCIYRPPSGDLKMFLKLFEKVGNLVKK